MRSQSFQQALPVIAGYIADRVGIRIRRGSLACTDSESITIPRLPELHLTQDDVNKTVGYLYHEAFHIKKSDFSIQYPSPIVRSLAGILEDIRIEAWGIANYPAARRYLGELVRILTEASLRGDPMGFEVVTEESSEAAILQMYGMTLLRYDVLGQHAIEPVLQAGRVAANKKFPSSMMVKYEALLHLVTECEDEGDCVELAVEIVKMIKDEQEEQDRQRQAESEQDTEDGEGTDAAQSNASHGPSQAPVESGPESASTASQEDEEDMNADQEEADAVPGSADEAGESAGGAGATGAGFGSGDLERLLSMTDEESIESIGDKVAEALNTMSRSAPRAVCMPNVHRLRLPTRQAETAHLKATINGIRTRTLQWMASVAECDVQHSRAGTMLDSARMHQARWGGEIFLRQDEGIDLNAAIAIVIDRSGSMSGQITEAGTAALAAMLAYDVQGITSQVSVFPVEGTEQGGSDVGVALLKDWNESARLMAGRVQSLTADGGTPMAEAVLFAATEVARRAETLKIVLVITDGMPDDLGATHDVIEQVRGNGISVLGLGIGVDPSAVFDGRFSAAIHDVQELAGSMVRLVKTALQH